MLRIIGLVLLLSPAARAEFTWETGDAALHAGGLVEAGGLRLPDAVLGRGVAAGLVADAEALGGGGIIEDGFAMAAYAVQLRAVVGGGAGTTPGGRPLPVLRLTLDGGASAFLGLGIGLVVDDLTLTFDTESARIAGRLGPGLLLPFSLADVSLVAWGGVGFGLGGPLDAMTVGLRGLSERVSFDARWRHLTRAGEGFAGRVAVAVAPLGGRVGLEAAFEPSVAPLSPGTLRAAVSYERSIGHAD